MRFMVFLYFGYYQFIKEAAFVVLKLFNHSFFESSKKDDYFNFFLLILQKQTFSVFLPDADKVYII